MFCGVPLGVTATMWVFGGVLSSTDGVAGTAAAG
jgi:hypothetical protein